MSSRHPHLRVHVRHDHPRLQEVQGEGLPEEGARDHRARGEGEGCAAPAESHQQGGENICFYPQLQVLIPVFALGRAQELCILLETFWCFLLLLLLHWRLERTSKVLTDLLPSNRERMNLKAPIYFSTGLTEKANHYYKLFITWTNQKIRKTFVQRNMFEFKHIKAFDRSYADNPGPMVPPPHSPPHGSSKHANARR